MNKFKIAIKALMLTIVVVCTVGCTKPDDPNNSGSNGGGNNGGNNGGGNEQTYTVSVSADPTNGGSVNGGGTYYDGQSCTLRAVANSGYSFKSWSENGHLVSTDENYTFRVFQNRAFVACFAENYIINVSVNPTNGGSVSGEGTYESGQNCTVTAIAANGYIFANWMADGNLVSTNPSYTFVVTSNCNLEANFAYIGGGTPFPGVIDGRFTINPNGDQVYFSKGNLQYFCSITAPQWRFAEHQYDYVTFDGDAYSENSNKWIDLFGWGTSGWNCGWIYVGGIGYQPFYQPWDTDNYLSETGLSHYFFGNDLTGFYANADWGVYNAISNGGNQAGLWRTLTMDEWAYIFYTRNTVSGIRYVKACVNNTNGVILLPDDWSNNYYNLSSTNTYDVSFNSNIIANSQWGVLEQHGAVFLPAVGYRNGFSVDVSVDGVNSDGYYWSASYDNYYGFHMYCLQYAFL